MKVFSPKNIDIDNQHNKINISWEDGHESEIAIRRLRGYCPCAQCQQHKNSISFIKNQVKGIKEVKYVGLYAVNFHFLDEHNTGIYSYEYLRKLDPSEEDKWNIL